MVRFLLCSLFTLGFISSYGQQIVHGTVIDESTNNKLPGVNIHIPYSLIGTSTSSNGKFELAIPSNTPEVLVSSIGYQSKVLKAPFSNLSISISLTPHIIQLSSVSIASKADKKWKQQFKKFRKEFIGNSKLARKCKVLNPWVVNFEKDNVGTLIATATEPIIIENKSTGYLVNFKLETFSKKGDVVTIAGKPYFKEQLSEDNVIKQMQMSSRKTTYHGSKEHFLYSLMMDLLDKEGFEIYSVSQNPTTGEFITKKRLKRNDIYRTGQLTSPDILKVVYTREEDEAIASATTLPANGGMTGSTIEASTYQVSYLHLRQLVVRLGANGIPIHPEYLVEYGYWNRDRVAELLPYEFIPKRLKVAQNKPVTIVSSPQQNTPTLNSFKLTNLKIPYTEIKRGGPPRDGIPSIDQPKFITSSKASLSPNQKVLGVTFNGISKAYPVSIMNWHEIVNDTFDGHPVVITYCPLCGSGITFDAMIDNRPTTFGVSGLLYNSDVLLYDRQTTSLWSQIEMMGVAGQQSGKSLKYINTTQTTWGAWKKRHPNTLLLSEQTGFTRNYEQSPYTSYALTDRLMFPVDKSSSDLPNKELVIGVNINNEYKAYALSILKKQKEEVTDQLGGQSIVIKYNKKGQSATVYDLQGKVIPSVQLYWFAWYAFHPTTTIYRP